MAELLARRLSHVFIDFKLCYRIMSCRGSEATVETVLETAKVLGHHLYGAQGTASMEAGMAECRAAVLDEGVVKCLVQAALPEEKHESDTGLSIVGFCRALSLAKSPLLLGTDGKRFLDWIGIFFQEMKSVAEVFEEFTEGFWGRSITM